MTLHGPRIHAGEAELRVWAPKEHSLELWLEGRRLPMRRGDDGAFSARATAVDGARYAFRFPDGRLRPDPASRRQPDGVHAPSALFDPAAYRWTDEGWRSVPLERLVFYEAHVGTFTEEGTLDAAAERLAELSELGVTCVELMPLQPFPGDRNWGYDGVAPYAVHESYGGPAALQRFVDRAHAHGLAVCLDVVYNHLGPEGNYLRDFGPYFTTRHKTPWGEGINFDGPDALPVRRFFVEAALQWLRDFHVDVLRLDAVHAIVDDSPRHLVREISDEVAALARTVGRQLHVIAESDLNDPRVVEPAPPGWGCSAMWSDDFHHALHALLTGERDHYLVDFGEPEQLARAVREGFVLQGEHSRFRKRPHGTKPNGLASWRLVTFAQNHDQVGNRPHGERLSTLLPFEALRSIAALVALGPGLPLFFMGEEYGETRPFLYFTSHTDAELGRAVSEGRRNEYISRAGREVDDPQALGTFLASRLTHRRDGRHGELRELLRRLLEVRRRHLESISTRWPEVTREGRALRLGWPTLELSVNLGESPALGLGPWGHEVREHPLR